ncbi:MAG: hypothetical protein ACO1RT_04625 [Planctomycetaceae bacterium]
MFRVALFGLAFVALIASSANAQNAVLAEMYGRGVHAYYSGDYATAYDFLTKAIDGGINDPRAYYFRGLTAVATGREADAESDYRAGAKLEAAGAFASVGPSLTRIQGSSRMTIENIRQQARLEYQKSAAGRARARYGEMQAAEQRVLRERPVPATPATPPPARPVPPAAAAAVPADAPNPFADGAAGEATVDSADALEGTMTDPFADDAAPAMPGAAEPAASEDPFGGSAAPAAGDPFGGNAAPAADPDPFGAGAGANSDPFQ